jgi:3-oxoacyl-[acyl-carrier-protein] synthase-3
MVEPSRVTSVGIHGLGVYLPPDVRHNDWWPRDVVAQWMEQRRSAPRPPPRTDLTEGERKVIEAMGQQALDPYQGASERRVLPSHMSVFDMEEHAARRALQNAGIDATQIDLLLTYTLVPDYLLSNPACILHQRLGLMKQCFTMHTDAATYSFMMQLSLAEAMISAGRARHALLVQSCAATRLIANDDPGSPLVGDGASAVVVGPVTRGRGLKATVHFADGRYPRTLIASVPGGSWFDEGRARMHVADWQQMNEVFIKTADVCKESVDAVLASSGHVAGDIDFLCVYQGTPWLGRLVQDYLEMGHARSFETFERLGYLSAAMIPANLCLAEEAGVLKTDDLVVLTGGGTGMTYGAALLRWGR